jgi:hypothetical protein
MMLNYFKVSFFAGEKSNYKFEFDARSWPTTEHKFGIFESEWNSAPKYIVVTRSNLYIIKILIWKGIVYRHTDYRFLKKRRNQKNLYTHYLPKKLHKRQWN